MVKKLMFYAMLLGFVQYAYVVSSEQSPTPLTKKSKSAAAETTPPNQRSADAPMQLLITRVAPVRSTSARREFVDVVRGQRGLSTHGAQPAALTGVSKGFSKSAALEAPTEVRSTGQRSPRQRTPSPVNVARHLDFFPDSSD
jgi:hypothetical protein